MSAKTQINPFGYVNLYRYLNVKKKYVYVKNKKKTVV